jgi:hypothetical protein
MTLVEALLADFLVSDASEGMSAKRGESAGFQPARWALGRNPEVGAADRPVRSWFEVVEELR